jgi:hypothetical protein
MLVAQPTRAFPPKVVTASRPIICSPTRTWLPRSTFWHSGVTRREAEPRLDGPRMFPHDVEDFVDALDEIERKPIRRQPRVRLPVVLPVERMF